MNYCIKDSTSTEAPRVCEQWRVIFVTYGGKDFVRVDVRTDVASRFGMSKEAAHEWAAEHCQFEKFAGYRLECW